MKSLSKEVLANKMRTRMEWTKEQMEKAWSILREAQGTGWLTENAAEDLDNALGLLTQAIQNLNLNLGLTKKGTTT